MIYKSNLHDVLTRLKADLLSPVKQDKLARTIATTLYADNIDRVFNKGFNVNNRLIGLYSRKPIYVNPKRSPVGFSTKGKYGPKKGLAQNIKTKRKHKVNISQTRYFAGGYNEFRQLIHRENSFVNLKLSGKLKTEFKMLPTKTGWAIGFTSTYGAKLSEGHEKRYNGDIWGITKGNLKQIDVIVNNFISKELHART